MENQDLIRIHVAFNKMKFSIHQEATSLNHSIKSQILLAVPRTIAAFVLSFY